MYVNLYILSQANKQLGLRLSGSNERPQNPGGSSSISRENSSLTTRMKSLKKLKRLIMIGDAESTSAHYVGVNFVSHSRYRLSQFGRRGRQLGVLFLQFVHLLLQIRYPFQFPVPASCGRQAVARSLPGQFDRFLLDHVDRRDRRSVRQATDERGSSCGGGGGRRRMKPSARCLRRAPTNVTQARKLLLMLMLLLLVLMLLRRCG